VGFFFSCGLARYDETKRTLCVTRLWHSKSILCGTSARTGISFNRGTQMRTSKRFHQSGKATIWEVAMVVCLAIVAIGLLLPALGALRRKSGSSRVGTTQYKFIQEAMVLFAQGNNNYYPCFNGRDLTSFSTPAGWSQGSQDGGDTSQRLALLLLQNYFPGEYIISPAEEGNKTIWTHGTLTTANYSFAMLDLPQPPKPATSTMSKPVSLTGRLKEWSNTTNALAPVLSDRSSMIDPSLITTSIWVTSTDRSPEYWRGTVVWNDNHVTFESSSTLTKTRFGKTDNTNDDLFTATSKADAFMKYGK
jgi:hypothetical protein